MHTCAILMFSLMIMEILGARTVRCICKTLKLDFVRRLTEVVILKLFSTFILLVIKQLVLLFCSVNITMGFQCEAVIFLKC